MILIVCVLILIAILLFIIEDGSISITGGKEFPTNKAPPDCTEMFRIIGERLTLQENTIRGIMEQMNFLLEEILNLMPEEERNEILEAIKKTKQSEKEK